MGETSSRTSFRPSDRSQSNDSRLDAHEVGERKDLVELGETDTFTDRDKLIRQKGSLPGKLAGARQSAVDGVDGTAIG